MRREPVSVPLAPAVIVAALVAMLTFSAGAFVATVVDPDVNVIQYDPRVSTPSTTVPVPYEEGE